MSNGIQVFKYSDIRVSKYPSIQVFKKEKHFNANF